MSIYRKEDIKAKLEKNLKDYQEKLAEWEKVERVKTKEGKDFKSLGKNFTNSCMVRDWQGLTLHTRNDEINAYIYTSKLKDEDPRKEYAKSWIDTKVDMTADELEESIKDTIERYKDRIKSYERQLKDLDKLFDEAVKLVEPIKELLKNETEVFSNGYSYPTTLCYALREYIQNALV